MKKENKKKQDKVNFEKRNANQAILNVKYQEGEGKVPIPGIDNVIEAKEWVDDVEK